MNAELREIEIGRTMGSNERSGPRPSRDGWRLLLGGGTRSSEAGDPDAQDGASNMAIDRALLESVRAGAAPALRLYRWERPTLSFGRNQPARFLYDEQAAASRGIGFVRRPTGGQAVLHADELTYAVVAPVAVIGKPRDAYRRINQGVVTALRELGVDAALAGAPVIASGATVRADRSASPATWRLACFREPAAGEVVAGGRKLVGSAQRCEGRVVLQHGSILVSGSQAAAEDLLLERPSVGASGGWTTVEGELGRRPSWSAMIDALGSAWRRTIGTALAPAALSDKESSRVEELRVRFASPEWTWRR